MLLLQKQQKKTLPGYRELCERQISSILARSTLFHQKFDEQMVFQA